MQSQPELRGSSKEESSAGRARAAPSTRPGRRTVNPRSRRMTQYVDRGNRRPSMCANILRARRAIGVMVMFVASGLVLVGVSWFVAFRIPTQHAVGRYHAVLEGGEVVNGLKSRGAGIESWHIVNGPWVGPKNNSIMTALPTVADLPPWIKVPAKPELTCTVEVTGWPLPCLAATRITTDNPIQGRTMREQALYRANHPPTHRWLDGIVWTYQGRTIVFPLRPLLWPLMIDWASLAIGMVCMLILPRRFRMMLRCMRGRCTICGYDLRGLSEQHSQRCPECGKVSRVSKRTSILM